MDLPSIRKVEVPLLGFAIQKGFQALVILGRQLMLWSRLARHIVAIMLLFTVTSTTREEPTGRQIQASIFVTVSCELCFPFNDIL